MTAEFNPDQAWSEFVQVVVELSGDPAYKELEATAAAGVVATPEVVVVCPKRDHRIAPVRIYFDGMGTPNLFGSRNTRPGVFTNGWAELVKAEHREGRIEGINYPVVRINCPSCTYTGRWSQGTLISLYVAAVRDGSLAIHLPA